MCSLSYQSAKDILSGKVLIRNLIDEIFRESVLLLNLLREESFAPLPQDGLHVLGHDEGVEAPEVLPLQQELHGPVGVVALAHRDSR